MKIIVVAKKGFLLSKVIKKGILEEGAAPTNPNLLNTCPVGANSFSFF